MNKGQLRSNSVTFLGISIFLEIFCRMLFFFGWFTQWQRLALSMVLSLGALVLGWMAFRLFWKGIPTGSNLGCYYIVFLVLNLIAGIINFFFTLTFFFALG